MSGLRPVSLYGLEVPPGDEPVPAFGPDQYPGTFKLTMAALNPFEKPIDNETSISAPAFIGATLRIIRVPDDDSDDEDDDEEDFSMAELLDGVSSEDDEDEDVNGGPSDPEKSTKAKRMAMLKEALAQSGEMELDSPKLSAKGKGKAKAVDVEEDDEDDEDDDEDEDDFEGPEEFVLCTLDPSKNYQQTLDITISEHETVYFQVSGTHTIYLTGNILIPDEGEMDDSDDEFGEDEDEDEYDLTPDDDELEMPDSEDESDELDDMEDPRVTEVESEDDAPKLVKAAAAAKKGKNKRAAPESEDNSLVDDKAATLDDLLAKSLKPADGAAVNGDKLSKKQKKKLKANGGNAVDAPVTAAKEDVGIKAEDATKPSPKADKKVQFSKTLIQGPTPSGTNSDASKAKTADAPKATEAASSKAGLSVKVIQGVTIDDKTLGQGPAAKKGDKVSMRYIGKLADSKKVFDSNKKGKPFTFQLGAGSVIKGWDIGIVGMTRGGERRITIPAHHAYGSKALPDIPANSTLVFDVKLLEIK